ncbi:MAG: multiheme c-type cytochrome, partial [Campylobacterota bacterium]|nr:multiheme c-type cytochrome [Campylobacterota bacterium]
MRLSKLFIATMVVIGLGTTLHATTKDSARVNSESVKDKNEKCVTCHMKENRSLVDHYENSAHSVAGVGCYTCHASSKDDSLGYEHEGAFIKTIQTPNDCKQCHEREVKEMTNSHHATAGQIMASLDNMLAEVIASFPDTKADAVNGCWQCHGSVIKPEKDKDGNLIRNEAGA